LPTYANRPARRKLPTPEACQGPLPDNAYPTVACHVTLACMRCGLCLLHCTCVARAQPVTPEPRRKRGQPEAPDPRQMQLCEKPDLHYADSALDQPFDDGGLPF
jgi:hypothetical protein